MRKQESLRERWGWGRGDGVNHQRKIVATHHGDVMNYSLSEKDLKTNEQIHSRLSFEKE